MIKGFLLKIFQDFNSFNRLKNLKKGCNMYKQQILRLIIVNFDGTVRSQNN